MDLRPRQRDGALVVAPAGAIDSSNAEDFRDSLLPLLSRGERCVVDFSAVEVLTSAGLRSLLSVARRARELGVALRFIALNAVVRDVMEVTGLDRVFDIATADADAAASPSGEAMRETKRGRGRGGVPPR